MLARIATVVGALALMGCNQIIDVPDNPFLDVQVDTGPWSCLGKTVEPPPLENTTAKVAIQACDFADNCGTNVPDLTARLCAKVDVGCTNPIKSDITAVDGLFEFEVNTVGSGFDGYLEVLGEFVQCTPPMCSPLCMDPTDQTDPACKVPIWAPGLLFFNPPVTADWPGPAPLPLFRVEQLLPIIKAATSVDVDPTAGNLFITAVDCDGVPASGVTFAISENQDKVTQLYVRDGAVTNTVLETDGSGVGGFINVPPGFAEIEAFNDVQDRIGSVGIVARAGFMTYSALIPSP